MRGLQKGNGKEGAEGWLTNLEGSIVARVQLYEGIDFIDGVAELEVGVVGWDLELCDEAVHLADEQADGQTLLAGLLDGLLGDQHDALHGINHQQHAVC